MKTIPLYKYERTEGGTTVSPLKPDCEYTEMYRLVADEGKILQNDKTTIACIDVESIEGWVEIEHKDEQGGNK